MDSNYSDVEYALYCDSLEEQYKQAQEDGLFQILKVLELDEEHSDSNLVEAIDYFNKKDGLIEKDAPINFLTEREKTMARRRTAGAVTLCLSHGSRTVIAS